MNLPNKLTMLRILLIPVFMVVLYWDFPGATWVAVAIFHRRQLYRSAGRENRQKVQLSHGFRQVCRPAGR